MNPEFVMFRLVLPKHAQVHVMKIIINSEACTLTASPTVNCVGNWILCFGEGRNPKLTRIGPSLQFELCSYI